MEDLTKRLRLEGIKLSSRLLETGDPQNQEILNFVARMRARNTEKMVAQLEPALTEREREGKVSPPTTQAKSRIAVCECCRQEIAIRREDATNPLKAESFDPIHPRSDQPAFVPGATWMWLICPFCRRRPWSSPDLVLMSDGFYHLLTEEEELEAKKLETAEVSQLEEK